MKLLWKTLAELKNPVFRFFAICAVLIVVGLARYILTKDTRHDEMTVKNEKSKDAQIADLEERVVIMRKYIFRNDSLRLVHDSMDVVVNHIKDSTILADKTELKNFILKDLDRERSQNQDLIKSIGRQKTLSTILKNGKQ